MLLRLTRFLIKCFMHLVFRLHIYNKENFPAEGAAIVAINHKSYWDAPLLASALPRSLHFMAKKELFSKPCLGQILRWSGAFPVSRDASDISAIKVALSTLRAGKVLAMFPEGRRVKGDEEHKAKAGVALIAEKTGAPIIPVAIAGKYGFLSRIDVYIDKPIWVKSQDGCKLSGDELQAISDQLMARIIQMSQHDQCDKKEQTYECQSS
ncbi:MAG: 1-acyl-sn-glycerol-3-phosphate acyltransferase [Ruminococcaceae bacterium]|nr:1-acyl-sn-glycerol-3-phosphate acyltransferase [Oscillospiraceae bacterium]